MVPIKYQISKFNQFIICLIQIIYFFIIKFLTLYLELPTYPLIHVLFHLFHSIFSKGFYRVSTLGNV